MSICKLNNLILNHQLLRKKLQRILENCRNSMTMKAQLTKNFGTYLKLHLEENL